jgi:hypothetical protein
MNKLNLMVLFAALVFTGSAKAQLITGNIGGYEIIDPTAISSTSFTLTSPLNVISYSGNLPTAFSSAYLAVLSPAATYTTAISSIPVVSYPSSGLGYPLTGSTLTFSSPIDNFFEFGAGSTTPLSFNLYAIQSINTPLPTFWGEGTLTQSGFASTPAVFQLIFNGSQATVTIAAETPEPSTWALLLAGISALFFIARRQRRA